jgi:hypothetical protein
MNRAHRRMLAIALLHRWMESAGQPFRALNTLKWSEKSALLDTDRQEPENMFSKILVAPRPCQSADNEDYVK